MTIIVGFVRLRLRFFFVSKKKDLYNIKFSQKF